MVKLTKKEQAWVDELQEVLDRCPSPKKIGFYTIGDINIHLYDRRKYNEVIEALDTGKSSDWYPACCVAGAHIEGTIDFPSPVESVAG